MKESFSLRQNGFFSDEKILLIFLAFCFRIRSKHNHNIKIQYIKKGFFFLYQSISDLGSNVPYVLCTIVVQTSPHYFSLPIVSLTTYMQYHSNTNTDHDEYHPQTSKCLPSYLLDLQKRWESLPEPGCCISSHLKLNVH